MCSIAKDLAQIRRRSTKFVRTKRVHPLCFSKSVQCIASIEVARVFDFGTVGVVETTGIVSRKSVQGAVEQLTDGRVRKIRLNAETLRAPSLNGDRFFRQNSN